MTDLDRVLARLEADPRFGDDLRSDPRSTLSDYELSDVEFAQVEQAVAATTPMPQASGIGTLFSATEPPRVLWRSRPWLAAMVGALAVGVIGGFGLGNARAGSDAAAAGGPGVVVPVELTPVAYSSCPAAAASTTHLGDLHRGDRVWVVGRDDSGRWLQVRSPSGDPVWVDRAAVAATDVERLDVVPCDLPGPAAPPGADDPTALSAAEDGLAPDTTTPTAPDGASTSTTAPTARPGPTTTTPGPTTTAVIGSPPVTPTPPVTDPTDHDGPVIQKAGGTPTDIWEHAAGFGGPCVTKTTSTVTASITDASDVATVQLDWALPGTPGRHGTVAMSRAGTTWTAPAGPFEWTAGAVPSSGADVGLTIRAVDRAGNPSSATTTLHLHSAEECNG